MKGNLRIWLRVTAAAIILSAAIVPVANAEGWVSHSEARPVHREMLWGLPRDDPAIGAVALLGGVALLVFMAWVAARFGDEK
jgi:hypothetical protein